ncbi:hypothetical protein, partial [Geojedonia litorea]
MYKITQIKNDLMPLCCRFIFKNLTKSITGLAMVMLFLFSANQAEAQIIIGDNDISDWVAALDNPAYPAKVFKRDPNATDDSQFTTGSQDPDLISEWGWNLGQTNNKGDISNAGAVIIGTRLYFFGDRLAINGDAQIGLWFFLGGVERQGDGLSNSTFSGMHVEGDLLVLSNFTNGGGTVQLRIFQWVDNPADAVYTGLPSNAPNGDESSGNLKFLGITNNAVVNSANVTIPSPGPFAASVIGGQDGMTNSMWTYQGKNVPSKGVPPPNTYHQGAFFEGFIALGDIIEAGGNACFASFLLETRNSQSVTASLQDFVGAAFKVTPEPPTTTNIAYCLGADAVALTPNGPEYLWYTSLDDETGEATIIPSTDTVGTKTYYVTQTYEDLNCESERSALVVTINPLPVVTANNASIECTNLTVQLTASPTGGTWSDVDGNVSASGLFDATGLANGPYNVTYTYTDGNGCTNSAGAVVTVNPAPTLEINCPTAVSVSCTDDINFAFSNWLDGFTTSGGGGTVTESYEVTVDGNTVAYADLTAPTNICDGSVISITYTVDDECDQSKNCSSTFTLNKDDTAPELTGTLPTGMTDIDDCIANAPVGPSEADIAALYADAC